MEDHLLEKLYGIKWPLYADVPLGDGYLIYWFLDPPI